MFDHVEGVDGDGIEIHGDAAGSKGEGDDVSIVGDDGIDNYENI